MISKGKKLSKQMRYRNRMIRIGRCENCGDLRGRSARLCDHCLKRRTAKQRARLKRQAELAALGEKYLLTHTA